MKVFFRSRVLALLSVIFLVAQTGHSDELVFVALGDSITYGVGTSPACVPQKLEPMPKSCATAQNYPAQIANLLAKTRMVEFQNLGISGEKVGGVITEEIPRISPAATLITLYIGTNDLWEIAHSRDPEKAFNRFSEDYQRAVETLLRVAPHAEIVLANVPNRAYVNPKLSENDHPELLSTYAKRINSQVINPFSDRGIVVVDFTCDSRSYESKFLADGLHPNENGAHWMAELFISTLIERTHPQLKCAPYL